MLAGLGRGLPPVTDEGERARMRRLALEWLRADFALWQQRAKEGPATQRQAVLASLNHWLTHDDLTGVREDKALRELPPVGRADWKQFWEDVAALRSGLGAN